MNQQYCKKVKFLIYKNIVTGDYFSIALGNVINLDKYTSNTDRLIVGYPINFDRKTGMINFHFEQKLILDLNTLVPMYITVSD